MNGQKKGTFWRTEGVRTFVGTCHLGHNQSREQFPDAKPSSPILIEGTTLQWLDWCHTIRLDVC